MYSIFEAKGIIVTKDLSRKRVEKQIKDIEDRTDKVRMEVS